MKDLTKTIIFTGLAGETAFRWLSKHKNKSKYIIKLILEDMIINIEDNKEISEWNQLKRADIDEYFDRLLERIQVLKKK